MAQFSIPLAALAERSKARLETVVRLSTLELFRRVTERSPVDTGRFKANWNVSAGAADYTTTVSVEQGRAAVEVQKALTLPVGGVMFLSNGLPYARRLEYGWSKQAPGGMVRLAAAEFGAFVIKATEGAR